MNDARNRIVGRDMADRHPKLAIGVDAAGIDLVADILGDRNRLPCHRSLVDLGKALSDFAVGGNTVAGPHDDDVVNRQFLDRNLLDHPIALAKGSSWDEIDQCFDAGSRAASRDGFEQLANGKEQDDDRRLLGCPNQQRAERGNRHQRFDAKRRSGDRADESPSCEWNDRDQRRYRVSDLTPFGREVGDAPGNRKHHACEDDETPLPTLPPRLVLIVRELPGTSLIVSARCDGGEAERLDLVLDSLRRGPVLIQHDDHAFLTVIDVDVADARQTLHRVFDLHRAGSAIHALDLQLQRA